MSTENKEHALALAQKATELDPRSQNAFWSLGFTRLYRNEYAEAAQAVRQSLLIAPVYADGIALLALIENYLGQADEAIRLINNAMLLNPFYSWDYLYNLGWAYYTLEKYHQAIEFSEDALSRNENARPPRLILAASYSALDMPDDAAWQIDQILTLFPSISLSYLNQESPFADPQKMNSYIDHLRQAGLPES